MRQGIYEKLPFFARYQRNVKRLVTKVMDSYRREHYTFSIAFENGISSEMATQISDRISYPLPKLLKVLYIDEFKGKSGGRMFQFILADPVKRRVLKILLSKNSEALISYFLRFPMEQRNHVEFLVMDMRLQFRDGMTVCFSKANVVNKFHVCRRITWTLDNVRKGA